MEKEQVIELLVKSNFLKLYRDILNQHKMIDERNFEFEPKILVEKCSQVQLPIKYYPKEKYFQISETKKSLKICVNFKMAPTSVILVLSIYENEKYQDFGFGSGSWGDICNHIDTENQEWCRPKFRSYDDLICIIKEARAVIIEILKILPN